MSDHHHPADGATDRLLADASLGCAESRLLISRRGLLGLGVGLFSAALMPKTALAGLPTDPRLLLVILRGGMDGLDVLVPTGDPDYVGRRKGLAIDPSLLTPLGGPKATSDYRLNPALANLAAMYDADEAAFVPATAIPLHSRSHFDCQDVLENGMPGLASSTTGWLNRALQVLSSSNPVRMGGALAVSEAPIVLRGPEQTLGWSLNWLEGVDPATQQLIANLYKARDGVLSRALTAGLKAHAIATDASAEDKAEAQDANMSRLRKGFRGAAKLLKADNGPRIAVITVDNFDTHGRQGALQNSAGDAHLFGRLVELDDGLGDFKALVGDAAWSNTVVVAVSEFGRKVEPNGSLGTDHGVGGLAILAGGAVKGGVHGDWPGLAELFSADGEAPSVNGVDLVPAVDTRAIFKGVLREHFGIGETSLGQTIFPSSAALPSMTGLVKTPVQLTLDVPTGAIGWRKPTAIAAYRERLEAGTMSA